MTSVKAGASPAWPAVRTNSRGRQRASAARWIFVVSPLRGSGRWHGRPAHRPAPPFAGPGRVLVGSHDRGVHRHGPVEVLVGVGLSDQGSEDLFPGASMAHIRSIRAHCASVTDPVGLASGAGVEGQAGFGEAAVDEFRVALEVIEAAAEGAGEVVRSVNAVLAI